VPNKKHSFLGWEDRFDLDLEPEIGYNGESIGIERWRPKSLQNLETNNGWVRIESEEDLPKAGNELYDVIVDGKKFRKPCFFDEGEFVYHSNKNIWKCQNITHYKPIEPELLPIY